MKPTHGISLAIISLVLVACVSASPERGGEAPATVVPTPASTSTSPAPTAPSAATPVLLDPCLLGVWTMDVYDLNNKFLDLTQSPMMYVIAPSIMTIEFRDDQSFALDGQITIRGDIPNGSDYMELNGYHQASGSYAADGRLISVIAAQDIIDFGALRVYIDGQLSEGPFNMGPPPEAMFSLPTDAAYICSGSSLQITFSGPLGAVTESWSR